MSAERVRSIPTQSLSMSESISPGRVREVIRVLHVIHWFRRGGIETQLLRIFSEYDRNRFHMDACVMGSDPGDLAEEAKSSGAEVLVCRRSANLLDFSRRFENLVKTKNYQVVHCHGEAWSGPILRGAFRAGVPVRISHARSSLAEGMEVGRNPLMRAARAVVVGWGRHWANRYATHGCAVSRSAMEARWPEWLSNPKRCVVWTGGVDLNRFGLADWHRTKDPAGQIIICVASLRPVKRHDLLLRIFAEVVRKVPLARLVLVGEGRYRARYRRLADRLGVAPAVDFLGQRDDVPELLRSAKVYVSCSEVEGLSNSLLEAQATGLGIVASDIPGNREALAREYHPFMFSLDTPEKAVPAIVRMLSDDSLVERLGRAGREHACRFYDSREKLEELQEYYVSWLKETVVSGANEKG